MVTKTSIANDKFLNLDFHKSSRIAAVIEAGADAFALSDCVTFFMTVSGFFSKSESPEKFGHSELNMDCQDKPGNHGETHTDQRSVTRDFWTCTVSSGGEQRKKPEP
jgi:hypothetical protein